MFSGRITAYNYAGVCGRPSKSGTPGAIDVGHTGAIGSQSNNKAARRVADGVCAVLESCRWEFRGVALSPEEATREGVSGFILDGVPAGLPGGSRGFRGFQDSHRLFEICEHA